MRIPAVMTAAAVGALLVSAAPAGASFSGPNGDIAVIAAAGARTPQRSLVFLTPAGTVHSTRALSEDAGLFSGSPDGRRLVFTQRGSVWVSDLDGRHRTRIAAGAAPAWAPDGRHVTYAAHGSIWVIGLDGHGRRRVTPGPRDSIPSWSPDGRTIAFVRRARLPRPTDCVEQADIYAAPAAGGAAHKLYATGFRCGVVWSFDWSPHSTRLAVGVYDGTTGNRVPDPRAAARVGITSVRTDGTGRRRLIDGSLTAVWAPDGSRLAYLAAARCRPADPFVLGTHVCTVRPDGSGIRDIAVVRNDIGGLFPPTWLVGR